MRSYIRWGMWAKLTSPNDPKLVVGEFRTISKSHNRSDDEMWKIVDLMGSYNYFHSTWWKHRPIAIGWQGWFIFLTAHPHNDGRGIIPNYSAFYLGDVGIDQRSLNNMWWWSEDYAFTTRVWNTDPPEIPVIDDEVTPNSLLWAETADLSVNEPYEVGGCPQDLVKRTLLTWELSRSVDIPVVSEGILQRPAHYKQAVYLTTAFSFSAKANFNDFIKG
jgi:hypothetical protein